MRIGLAGYGTGGQHVHAPFIAAAKAKGGVLGSHLVDQMLRFLGPALSVDAALDRVELTDGRTDASFAITVRRESGVHSQSSASKLTRLTYRKVRAYGGRGSPVPHATDVQAQASFSGLRPVDDFARWGYEPDSNRGVLRTTHGEGHVPAEQGRSHDDYEAFAKAVPDGGPPPVTAGEGARTLAVLDAARLSAAEGRTIIH